MNMWIIIKGSFNPGNKKNRFTNLVSFATIAIRKMIQLILKRDSGNLIDIFKDRHIKTYSLKCPKGHSYIKKEHLFINDDTPERFSEGCMFNDIPIIIKF